MKISEFFSWLAFIMFLVLIIGGSIFAVYLMYQEYHSYSVWKNECNQDKNKDLCFCYHGECEIRYECSGEGTQTIIETINGEIVNSSQTKINGTCKDFDKRICEIATKAKDKKYMWKYCK